MSPAAMRAMTIFFQALVLSGLVSACYTDAPTRLPEAAELGLVPLTQPNLTRGEALFAQECASCHGETGRGDGWQVATINGPRPRNFHDVKMVGRMSPARAYLAVTQGVPRTSMKAFDLLSEPDRWHLAFYALSLGYTEEDAAKGQVALAALRLAQPTPRTLSELSNTNILDELRSRQLDDAAAHQVLAYLRRDAAFADSHDVLAPASRAIVDAIADYRKGFPAQAKSRFRAAHLNHLKSKLKVIRLRDSGLALAIERELDALQGLMQRGAPLRDIETKARILFASLEIAEPVLSQPLSAGVGIAQSATVALSYAIDGAICLFLLLVIGTRRGADRSERKAVGLGVIIGIILAVIIWLGWQQVAFLFSGSTRASISLVVSGLITLGSVPLLVATVRYFRTPPQTRIRAAPVWLFLLFALPCAICVRDALEVVPALASIATFSPTALLGFVGAGIAMICLVGVLVAIEKRVALTAAVALVCCATVAVSVLSSGSALRSAQNLGLLEASAAGHLQSPWVAFWPTGEGIFAQLCFATACFVALAVTTLMKVGEPRAVEG